MSLPPEQIAEAPAHTLPTWKECEKVMDSPNETTLARFIYDYDDADDYHSDWFMHRLELVIAEACTEQATEIAELKAKLAGAEAEIAALKQGLHRASFDNEAIMPLARFGAMSARKWMNDAHNDVIYEDLDDELIETVVGDVFLDEGIAPNIEATMVKLLKD
jgi:hypothetical protein